METWNESEMPQSRIIGIEIGFIIILGPAASHLHNNLIKLCVSDVKFSLKYHQKWSANLTLII